MTEPIGETEPPSNDVETLLRNALRPIDPPESLASRMEDTLTGVKEAAAADLSAWAEELSDSELASLKAPRNWVRPVVAGISGAAAGGALVVLGLRHRRRR